MAGSNGKGTAALHATMLEVAFQIYSCDLAGVIVLPFFDFNKVLGIHSTILSDGSHDSGEKFRTGCGVVQSRIAKMIDQFSADSALLENGAIVYSGEGDHHLKGNPFDRDHPKGTLPMMISGNFGGTIQASGEVNAKD